MLRRLASFCALLLAVTAAPLAKADVGAIDYSDLWWNPAENGWGVAIQRQADVLFVALYHYGGDGTPTWYVASDVRATAAAAPTWSGKLYRASGPVFSQPFAGPAELREAGELTLAFLGADAARLTYTVAGVTTTQAIERMTFRVPSAAGTYYGGFSATVSRCNDPNFEGPLDIMGTLTVTEAADRTTLRVVSTGLAGLPSTCTFAGPRRQAGRSGAVEGAYTCNIVIGHDDRGENIAVVQRTGTFLIERMTVGVDGFSARFNASDQDCTYLGSFGGVKR